MSKKQGFIEGAFILLVSNLIVKILGAFFKIPLTNLLGASGIGTFSIAYNIFALMFVIGSAGLPVAISKLICEENALGNTQNSKRVISCAFYIFVTISAILTVLTFVFAKELCVLISNENAYFSLISIVPAILVVTIISILRGYFQGNHDMTKTAISQLLEAITKVLLGYFFAKHLILEGYDETVASAGAIFGVTLSTIISAIYLIFCYIFRKKEKKSPDTKSYKEISKKLLSLSIPITLSASILSLTGIIDMVTIMNMLKSNGFSESLANEFYGAYNMAITVYTLPQTLILSLSVSIIPNVCEHYTRRNTQLVEKSVNAGLLLSTIFAFPCSIGLITLSTEILGFLYYKQPEDILVSSPALVVLAYAVVLVSIVTITNSNMQGISKQFMPLKGIFLGISAKVVTNIFLIPKMNISGAGLGTVVCFFVIAVINIRNLNKYVKLKFDKILLKPAISSIFMYFFIEKSKFYIDTNSKLLLCVLICISAIFYFLTYFLIGGAKDVKELIGRKTKKF